MLVLKISTRANTTPYKRLKFLFLKKELEVEILISFIVATSALAFSPGPDNIYVLLQSMTYGRSYGLATVGGLISGCIVHTTLVAFGISAIIRANDTLFFILKLLGALYLFYLAYQVYRHSSSLDLESRNIHKKTHWGLFKQGVLMNVLNPKVSIFFLAFFPSFLFSQTMSTVVQFYILGLLFMFVSLVIFSTIAILAGQIAKYTKGNDRISIFFKWLQIAVFLGIGIFIVLSEK